ncbi:MAG: flagellar basal-body rod protein FlgF [Pseudomonadota bacterium]
MSGEISGIISKMKAQEMRLEVMSNNMANSNTVGFKEDRVFRLPESNSTVWDSLSGVSPKDISSVPVYTFTNFEQGHLKETGNALDVALGGEGFFAVQTSQGLQYTRKGNFALSSDGTLVTQEGHPVMGNGGGKIQIAGEKVVVSSSGAILVDGVEVDALKIVDFADKKRLLKMGDSLYSQKDPNASVTPADNTLVQQGFIEASNVDTIKMMTDMIDVMRGYETYQKTLQYLNETNSKTNEIGKLS